MLADVNHLLFNGQSLAVGYLGNPSISVSQPYSNITFSSGPRAAGAIFSSFVPLVETDEPDLGETPCSGAANYAATLMAVENAIDPSAHVILASTGGSGGEAIANLSKPQYGYTKALAHVIGAKALAPSYAVHAMAWMQSEQDVYSATTFATYRAALAQLQVDMTEDVQTISGQTHPVHLLTNQVSYGAATHPDIALAQLDLAQAQDGVTLVTPCYHLPFNPDGIHLLPVGSKWIGAYIGRAYKRIVINKQQPKWLNPVSATLRGTVLRIRFDVPHRPLTFDTVSLAATVDHGFVVTNAGVPVTITALEVSGDEVVITLAAEPTGVVVVRYALDNLAPALTITNGASGNLRDSDPSFITISGTDYPLYNVAPHFRMTAIRVGE